MSDLPRTIISVLSHFASLFSRPVFCHVKTMFSAHIISKGRRCVTDLLRSASLTTVKNFSKYHDVFSKAKWSTFSGAKILFFQLLRLIPQSEIQIVMDSTIQRRKGTTIKGLGRKRDPVASTKDNKVLCIGQEWLVTSILIKFPWALVQWACPFLTILMPPKQPLRSSRNKSDLNPKKKSHKKTTQWARQVAYVLRRWLGKTRKCSLIADSAFACYSIAHTCVKLKIGFISRLRLDARIFPYPPTAKGRGRERLVGKRIRLQDMLHDPALQWHSALVNWYGGEIKRVEFLTGEHLWYAYGIKPVAIRWILLRGSTEDANPTVLFSTDLTHDIVWIIESFVSRWKLEVTFEEVRRHFGFETQRHWSDKAVDRITPSLLASFSIVCLCGKEVAQEDEKKVRPQQTTWYTKKQVTFSDVLSLMRGEIMSMKIFLGSSKNTNLRKKAVEELLAWVTAA